MSLNRTEVNGNRRIYMKRPVGGGMEVKTHRKQEYGALVSVIAEMFLQVIPCLRLR